MGKAAAAVLLLLAGTAAPVSPLRAGDGSAAALPPVHGPFPMRMLHPVTAPFYQPLPDSARTLPAGRLAIGLGTQYGSVQKAERSAPSLAVFDGEFSRISLSLRYGLLENLEAHVELPLTLRGVGFLDDAITWFHDATGFVADRRDRNRFDELLVIDGKRVIDNGSQGYRVADIPLQLKYGILDERRHPVTLAVRAAVEIPSGDESEWIGNGRLDGGIGVLAERTLGDFTLYANLDYRFPGRPRRLAAAGLGLRSAIAGMGAIEWRVSRRIALTAQLGASQSIFRDAHGLETLGNPQVQLFTGMHFRLSDSLSAHAGITEDVVRASSPDVVFFLGVTWGIDLLARRGKR